MRACRKANKYQMWVKCQLLLIQRAHFQAYHQWLINLANQYLCSQLTWATLLNMINNSINLCNSNSICLNLKKYSLQKLILILMKMQCLCLNKNLKLKNKQTIRKKRTNNIRKVKTNKNMVRNTIKKGKEVNMEMSLLNMIQ